MINEDSIEEQKSKYLQALERQQLAGENIIWNPRKNREDRIRRERNKINEIVNETLEDYNIKEDVEYTKEDLKEFEKELEDRLEEEGLDIVYWEMKKKAKDKGGQESEKKNWFEVIV